MKRFATILVANRGEIACRVLRTARDLGYRTVAVHTAADSGAPHVAAADRAVTLGAAPNAYLSIEAVLAAARATGADAVHPGYGFLSENPAFAEACAAAGIAFIGPPPAAMRAMGGKAPAKALMRAAGVPVVPGYDGEDQSDGRLVAEAEAIGFPVMVKASAGGGGRGMRLVAKAADLPGALASARAEALAGFGDDRLLLEKAVMRPRHVEIQVMADSHGHAVHLGERDCSVQRRHQKVIEEAPAVPAALRDAMGASAVRAALAVGYVGAGTVEFLLDGEGKYYFLEMNTRLQVEHPVTEAITGLDLVALQIAMAEGGVLPFAQDALRLAGHAIEVRLCAEDTGNDFLPATGRLIAFEPADGVRTDSGVVAGSQVTPHYDSLLAKVIAHGATREEARQKLVAALRRMVVLGVTTNRDFLIRALDHPDFVSGPPSTAFIAEVGSDLSGAAPANDDDLAIAAALLAGAGDESPSPAWRATTLSLEVGGAGRALTVRREGGDHLVGGLATPRRVAIAGDGVRHRCRIDNVERAVAAATDGATLWLDSGRILAVTDMTYAPPRRAEAGGDGRVLAPMTGTVARLMVAPGDRVRRGAVIAVLEAMKMEHNVVAAIDGTVDGVLVAAGQQVSARKVLATIVAEEA